MRTFLKYSYGIAGALLIGIGLYLGMFSDHKLTEVNLALHILNTPPNGLVGAACGVFGGIGLAMAICMNWTPAKTPAPAS